MEMNRRAPDTLCVLLLLVVFGHGQSVLHLNRCTALAESSVEAITTKPTNWQRILDSSRDYLSECADILQTKTQARLLDDIGWALIEQDEHMDAIPVLKRCVAVDPDYALCWYRLGRASEGIGRRFDAKAFWRKTIDIGGTDKFNALAVKMARDSLNLLLTREKLLGDRLPPDPSAPQSV